MRSPSFLLLLTKEFRELFASRAFWIMLLIAGLLVGHAFITAVGLYAEMSGGGGGPAALPQGLTPLDGILVPTWGAYDLAATLLFPFVAIRLIAVEKETGALKLLLQLPGATWVKVAAKAFVLVCAWLVSWIPGVVAIVLWRKYGGHVYRPETFNLLLGHLLRGLLSAGIAVAAGALAESAASAAIVTLGFTVGAWALDFVAAGRGGLLQQLATYTPTAALRTFEQGMLRLNVVLVMLVLSCAGFALAAIWLHTGRTLRARCAGALIVVAVAALAAFGGAKMNTSWDVSENRRNSFDAADEAKLKQINQPLKITVYLSPEDPRLTDFEQNVLRKLRRALSGIEVDYAATSATGLFETDHYGEIWYELGGQKAMERSTIEEVVLDQIYKLANVDAPERASAEGEEGSGYPLAAQPKYAKLIFYLLWPVLVILLAGATKWDHGYF